MNKKRLTGEIFVVLAVAIFLFNIEITGAVIGSAASNLRSLAALVLFIRGLMLINLGIGDRVIDSLVKQDPLLFRVAEKVGEKQSISRDINHLIKELNKGNTNPGVGTKTVSKGIYELRGRSGGRVYFRKAGRKKYELLGYSDKNTQSKVINRLKKLYD